MTGLISLHSLTTISRRPSWESGEPVVSGKDAHTSVKVPPLSMAILMDLSGSSVGELLREERKTQSGERQEDTRLAVAQQAGPAILTVMKWDSTWAYVERERSKGERGGGGGDGELAQLGIPLRARRAGFTSRS